MKVLQFRMMLRYFLVLLYFGLAAIVATAGNIQRPHLSIQVRDGSFGGLEEGLGLDPTISWEHSNDWMDDTLHVSYGLEASVRASKDVASWPKRRVWGKAALSDIAGLGWNVAAKAQVDASDVTQVQWNVDVDQSDYDLQFKLQANGIGIGKSSSSNDEDDTDVLFRVQRIEATKGVSFVPPGGAASTQKEVHLTVTPRWDLDHDERDVVVKYETDTTFVKVIASAEAQQVTVSQQLDDDNRIAPTFTSQGDVSLEYERRFGQDSIVKANFNPKESLQVEWKDAAWTANVHVPIIDGTSLGGAQVSIKRDVQF